MPRSWLTPCLGWLLTLASAGSAAAAEPSKVSRPVTFERDIQPILTRAGCNSGPCHGKARGQNGFALSLLAFDNDFDHAAITKEARGRRLFPASPEDSLLLLKATARVPHAGGKRFDVGSDTYQSLLSWIVGNTPRTPADAPKLVKVSVSPTERTLKTGQNFPLKVAAHFSDGSSEDVTHLAAFQSNEPNLVTVTPDGQVKAGPLTGEATISARFGGIFANCDVSMPLDDAPPASFYDTLPKNNFIDGFVWKKLQVLGLTPSREASDAIFLRRAFLDVIGRIPSPEETRAFLDDKAADRRSKLIDRLLDRPEYADHWANKWTDLLRPNPYRVGIKAVMTLDNWIRDAFRENRPYDQFVRQIVTAQGSTFHEGPSVIFRDRREPEELTPMMSQLFLGIRLECAKCHHHPFESWGQEQFYEFAAYFARVGRKGTGLSPPISGSEEMVFAGKSGSVSHPLTGKVLPPKPLFGQGFAPNPEGDYREALADWMTGPENAYFAKVIVNRVWADLMGRGIVEPVDDIRATNPPSNGPLLDELAREFRRQGFDLKKLIKTIMSSRVYALSSEPNGRNRGDTRNFSRHYRQRLRAEILLDAICDATDVPEKFDAAPLGTRANALWTVRSPSLFLDTFGRPDPNQDPPCERTSDSSVVQALHLMNAPALHEKVTNDEGRAVQLAKSKATPKEIVEELYLATFNRRPDAEELKAAEALFAKGTPAARREAAEDLLWALINSAEFVFKD